MGNANKNRDAREKSLYGEEKIEGHDISDEEVEERRRQGDKHVSYRYVL